MDWYVILFVAITLIIFHMKEFGEHRNPARYIQDRAIIPVSVGTMQLLFRLMTGTFLFVPYYFTISFGYMAGLGLAVTGAVVLAVFSRLAEAHSKEIAALGGSQSFLKGRFTKRGLFAFYIVAMIAAAEGLIINTLLAVEFLKRTFGVSSFMAAISILAFGFIFGAMGGIGGVRKMGTWLIMIFFTGISLLPLSAFLLNGAKPIYLALQINNHAGLNLDQLLAAVLLFMPLLAGHLLIYLLLTNELISLKGSRIKLSIGLGAISWSSIPMAISLIVLYFIAVTNTNTSADLLAGLLDHLPLLLIYVIVFVILSSLALGIGLSLFSLVSIFFYIGSGERTVQGGYLFSLLLCLVPLAFINQKTLVVHSFLFYVNLFSLLAFPMWLTIRKRIIWRTGFSAGVLLMTILGTWLCIVYGWMTGLPLIMGVSIVVYIVKFIRNIRKI